LNPATFSTEIGGTTPLVWKVCRIMLRYVCPVAILAVLLAAFLPSHP
jgi:hypothetical protein